MNKAMHTPGPWTPGLSGVYDEEGFCVAMRHPQDCGRYARNAQLISAAPELLEALVFAVDRFETLVDAEEATELDVECLNNARAVIAKARGQA